MGRNFIILFEEKEGTTPIVRLLDNFESIDIVHQSPNSGWEPFDRHCCGAISARNYRRCLNLIFNDETPYMEELNQLYTQTARNPLHPFSKDRSVGFKMRFRSQRKNVLLRRVLQPAFARYSIELFRENEVVVFVAVRQDIFRWALSRYHGDGTGRPGHLQFKLANRQIERSMIPKIHVKLESLGRIVDSCERQALAKRNLIARLNGAGVSAWPMLYESFQSDSSQFFSEVLARLEISSAEGGIATALRKGTEFEKVHSDDIREFVVNADEVLRAFGNRYISW